jgi:cobalt-zinc-cadmium efflux system membrane fusion protein
MKVRLASPDVAARAGVALTTPQTVSLADGIAIPGRVAFNRSRLAHITPMATGVVRRVLVRPGARVGEGEVLAEVAMPEMASLKAQLLSARAREAQTEAAYLREKDLLARGISSRHEFQLAESDYRSAQSATAQYRQQLRNFGLSPSDLRQQQLTTDGGAMLSLRAPFAGTVVEVNTALGEAVGPGTPLFTVADLDVLWIELSLPESRIHQARVGAPVQARFDGLPGMSFDGRIFQIGAALDERTRTLKALAEVVNPDHRLKSGMFGKVRLLEGDETRVLALPADSLQSIDGLSYVFVQEEPDLFELRRVQAGAKGDGMVPILAGISPGEQVVSGQGFALKSEVLKARLGASCADH